MTARPGADAAARGEAERGSAVHGLTDGDPADGGPTDPARGWTPDAAQRTLQAQGARIYIVGGAVRDALLGLPAGDRDWVVVGATPERMAAAGFLPVGIDFPVFLHPKTREEYALARTERKSGKGYKGFVFHAGPEVTLEDDLRRRDLTINAMARAADGALVDPLGGEADLRAGRLRHVGQAFSEDPVRLLRLARFAARFDTFTVAPETQALARELVELGEVDALVPERVWQEVAKGLMTKAPWRMFEVLADSGALERALPGLVYDARVARALAAAVAAGLPMPGRYALLWLSSAPADLGRCLKAPSECQALARLLPVVLQWHDEEGHSASPEAWLALIERCDALRRPERFLDALASAACASAGPERSPVVETAAWPARLAALRGIDAGAIARRYPGRPADIQAALREARLAALASLAQS